MGSDQRSKNSQLSSSGPQYLEGRTPGKGQPGPYEAALAGHKLHDPKQPVEILRTIHSFDPCIACAVHITDPEGEELIEVKVL